MEINGLRSQFGVQLAWFSIQSRAVIVEDTIGDIARLLHFCQEDAATNGMNSASRDVEHITGMHLMSCQNVADAAIFHSLAVFVRRNRILETGIEVSSRLCINDVPHLRLSEFSMLSHCHFVARVYLNAQIFLSINEFYE